MLVTRYTDIPTPLCCTNTVGTPFSFSYHIHDEYVQRFHTPTTDRRSIVMDMYYLHPINPISPTKKKVVDSARASLR